MKAALVWLVYLGAAAAVLKTGRLAPPESHLLAEWPAPSRATPDAPEPPPSGTVPPQDPAATAAPVAPPEPEQPAPPVSPTADDAGLRSARLERHWPVYARIEGTGQPPTHPLYPRAPLALTAEGTFVAGTLALEGGWLWVLTFTGPVAPQPEQGQVLAAGATPDTCVRGDREGRALVVAAPAELRLRIDGRVLDVRPLRPPAGPRTGTAEPPAARPSPEPVGLERPAAAFEPAPPAPGPLDVFAFPDGTSQSADSVAIDGRELPRWLGFSGRVQVPGRIRLRRAFAPETSIEPLGFAVLTWRRPFSAAEGEAVPALGCADAAHAAEEDPR